MAIALATKLGSVKLSIEATLRNDRMQKVGEAALAHLVFHKVPAKVEGWKENRDEAYSDALAAKVVKALEEVVGECFTGIKVETSEYVKQEGAALKAIRAKHDTLKAAGVDEGILKESFPELYPKAAAAETTEESVG